MDINLKKRLHSGKLGAFYNKLSFFTFQTTYFLQNYVGHL